MPKKAVILAIALVLLLGTFAALNTEPVVKGLTGVFSSKDAPAPAAVQTVGGSEAKMLESFVSSLTSASRYSCAGTKKITGDVDSAPSTITFSATVSGHDYALSTAKNAQAYRQLFAGGKYTLIDDTSKTVYEDVCYIGFPGDRLTEAFTGRLTRVKEVIFRGNRVNCFEVYKNGIVYALYFSKSGSLIRCYYIYDSHEITIDFTEFAIGDATGASFSIPAAYARRGSRDFYKQ